MKNQKKIEQAAGLILIGLIAAGCIMVLMPYMSAILWAAIVCFATWPLHELMIRWLKGRRTIAAALMTLLLAAVLFVPFLVIGFKFAESIKSVMAWIDSHKETGFPGAPDWARGLPLLGDRIAAYWDSVAANTGKFASRLQPYLKASGLWLLKHSIDFGKGIFFLGLSLFISFFLYIDGAGIVTGIREAFRRISGEYSQHLVDVVGSTIQSVVYGLVGTALAQGILAAAGFAIAGVPSPLMLGLFTFFLSIIPFGPPIVWIGASWWLFQKGHSGFGFFMIIYGVVVISSVDNLIKPYLISRGTKLPFALTLLGVLGGIAAFGFIGIFLGPTLLAAGYSLLQEITGRHAKEKSGEKKKGTDKKLPVARRQEKQNVSDEKADQALKEDS